jgi:phospholipid/cholesterol/gamma-HCH transport system substrate-binding protein
MPQRERVTWAQLRVGIMVIVSLAIFALGVFFISGQVGFLSRRYTLKAYFSTAGGLREGAQVRLAGIAVGNVERLRISSYPEANRAVEVVMQVSQAYQDQIRADSVAIMETVGLLGESYVDISRGGVGQAVIPDGGEVKASEEADIAKVVKNANDVISNLRVLSSKLNEITTQIQAGKGSMGKLIYDQTLYNRLNDTTGTVQRLVTQVENGQGTLGKLLSDETLYQRTTSTIDRLNKVLDDVQHGNGSLAKLISDPSMFDNVNRVVTRADTLLGNINSGQGTLGKLANDPQLYNRLNETADHMNVITTRIDQGQGSLGRLSTDTALYNNLNESSQSLKEFLTEFRKNPKKYLTVKVRLF